MTKTGYQPPRALFRANDIRGVAHCAGANDSVVDLTEEFALYLGRALGTVLIQKDQPQVWLCRDARLSSPRLHAALVEGLLSTGCEILDLGVGPTPLLCHAAAAKPEPYGNVGSGIMITASHNPPEYNGFKIIIDDKPFFGEELAALRELIVEQSYIQNTAEGIGKKLSIDHQPNYLSDFRSRLSHLNNVKIVLDTANGAAGPLAIAALEAAGAEVIALYCDMDGNFPNHSPDTSNPENLRDLVRTVRETKAFCGIALDGDGDRMVAITAEGIILNADNLMQVFSRDILDKDPNATIVFDVKSSRHLVDYIQASGGRPLMVRSGRSFIQDAMYENKASLAGEFSSHFFFADQWYGSDDGIYAGARLLEICQRLDQSLAQACETDLLTFATDEISITVPEEKKFGLIEDFVAKSQFQGASLVTIDGLRIEYPAGWALLRASNTTAAITLRFEADSEAELNRLILLVRLELEKIEPSLDLGKLDAS